jgi:amidase
MALGERRDAVRAELMDTADVAFAGAAELARMLGRGVITAPQLIELYLDRIARFNPELNAYRVVLADTARTEADSAQRRLDAGVRLPLLGVPVAVKDDVDVAGQVTTVGSRAHGPAKSHDSEVVRRLRDAGATILGKTTLPELCIWGFTETIAFGATCNPWDTTRTPGGSSGGSAAVVAAGLAPIAVGSDAGGSIRIPAAWCGLFGIKPQRGRVPMAPRDDAWHGLTVNGPLTRTVEDAALFLDATTTMPAPEGGFVAAAARPPGHLRIALSTKVPPPLLARVGTAQRAAVHEAGVLLRGLGQYVVARDPDYPAAATIANWMPRYLRGIRDDALGMPRGERLESRTRTMVRLGALISDRRMVAVRAAEAALTRRVLTIFDDVDVLITPATAAGPSRIGAYRKRGAINTLSMESARFPFQTMFNVTGQPVAVVPWGLDSDGLPLAIQLVGRPSEEATLLALSAQIEAARPWAQRRPPIS